MSVVASAASKATAPTQSAAKTASLKFEESKAVADVQMSAKPSLTSQRSQMVLGAMKPKNVRTAYIFFCSETVTKLLSENKSMVNTEAIKKVGELWNGLADADKAKYTKLHDDDAVRYANQCAELSKNGFFLLEDGRKSCDVPVKLKFKAPPAAPVVKTKSRGVQTGRDLLLMAATPDASPVKSKVLGKRPRSEKTKSPKPTPEKRAKEEISFGKETASP